MPEGRSYVIVIPSNVEYIIRKFCAKAPDNEWSGTLFYQVEGNFNEGLRIICKDFLLMDLGSAAFTEFDEDGTAIDYMVQHPELLDCQMGLLHSHDRMTTFFSGTDTNTLNKEGNDRNNFVSLIVNNAGTYSAAITRKVTYKEIHNIEITGQYPFFGTRQVFNTPTAVTSEEKEKLVIEWFDLTIEKQTVEFQEDEYDARFREISNKATPASKYPYYGGYNGYAGNYRGSYNNPYKGLNPLEDDDDGFVTTPKLPGFETPKEKAPESKPVNPGKPKFNTVDVDPEELSLAERTACLTYKVKELAICVATGCPVYHSITPSQVITDRSFENVFDAFRKEKYSASMYEAFVSDSLAYLFTVIDASDYFPADVVNNNDYTAYMLEDILLVKLFDVFANLDVCDMSIAAAQAVCEMYAV